MSRFEDEPNPYESPRASSGNYGKRRGGESSGGSFTLIELLVVVVITLMLLSLWL